MEDAIESLANTEGGRTALYDSMIETINLVDNNASNAASAVIAFTDGNDNDSQAGPQSVINAALGKMPVIVIVLNDGGTTITTQNEMTQIAVQTGGAFIEAQDVTGVISAYSSMAEFLTGSAFIYNLRVQLTHENGTDWFPGEFVSTQLRINLPGSDDISVPVQFTVQ